MKSFFVIFVLFFTGCQQVDIEGEKNAYDPPNLYSSSLLLTFDDFPCQRETGFEEQYKINKSIQDTLQKYGTSAMVFVNSCGIYRDENWKKREKMLSDWARAGHDVGNHTYSHPPLSKTTVFNYKIDIIKCEPVLKRILHEYGRELKYFRYPFLDYGKNVEQRVQIKTFLRSRGYEVVSITLDTLDWKFNRMLYDGDNTAKALFVAYVKSQLDKHIQNSKNIILFHINRLTSECLEDIIQYAKSIGYKLRENKGQEGKVDEKNKS